MEIVRELAEVRGEEAEAGERGEEQHLRPPQGSRQGRGMGPEREGGPVCAPGVNSSSSGG